MQYLDWRFAAAIATLLTGALLYFAHREDGRIESGGAAADGPRAVGTAAQPVTAEPRFGGGVASRRVWEIADVHKSRPLVVEFGTAIEQCRRLRLDLASGAAQGGSTDLSIGGRSTSCDEVFNAYAGEMGHLLAPLRKSTDPVERGYYFDGQYNDLADDYELSLLNDPAIADRKSEHLTKTDELFLEVLQDAKSCDVETLVRLFLNQKLTSPRFDTAEVRFFVAYALVVHDYMDKGLVSYMQMAGNLLPADRREAIKLMVFDATKTCSPGQFTGPVLALAQTTRP